MVNRPACEFPWLTRLAQRWYERRTYAGADLPGPGDLAARKRADGASVSVVLPALNEGETVGAICRTITRELIEKHGLVDELFVIDADSTDETASEARANGAQVLRVSEIIPEIPVVRGKGESLWRSLHVVSGDLVVWIDADIRDFQPHFVSRLVAPLIMDDSTSFVKGFYRRPIAHNGDLLPSGGGRVTELLARPMLNALFPELGGLLQPLAGEYAGRRDMLQRVPFFTGYSVEVGLLVDLLERVGLDSFAQVDLEERVHRNRPLDELGPMAYAIGRTILRRAEEWGRVRAAHDYPVQPLLMPDADGGLEAREVVELERPPISQLATSPEALKAGVSLALPG